MLRIFKWKINQNPTFRGSGSFTIYTFIVSNLFNIIYICCFDTTLLFSFNKPREKIQGFFVFSGGGNTLRAESNFFVFFFKICRSVIVVRRIFLKRGWNWKFSLWSPPAETEKMSGFKGNLKSNNKTLKNRKHWKPYFTWNFYGSMSYIILLISNI